MRGCQGTKMDVVLEMVLQALTVWSRLTEQCLDGTVTQALLTLPLQLASSNRSLGTPKSERNLLNWCVPVRRRHGFAAASNKFFTKVGRIMPDLELLMQRLREVNTYLVNKRIDKLDITCSAQAMEVCLDEYERAIKPYRAHYERTRRKSAFGRHMACILQERAKMIEARQTRFIQLVKETIRGPHKKYILERLNASKKYKVTGATPFLAPTRSLWIRLHVAAERYFTFAVPCTPKEYDELLDSEMRHLNISGTSEEHIEVRDTSSNSSSGCSCDSCLALDSTRLRNRRWLSLFDSGPRTSRSCEYVKFKPFEPVDEDTVIMNRIKTLCKLSEVEGQTRVTELAIENLCEVFECLDKLQTYDPLKLWQFTLGYYERPVTPMPQCKSDKLNKLWSRVRIALNEYIKSLPATPTRSLSPPRIWYQIITTQRILRWSHILIQGSCAAKRKREWEIELPPGDFITEDMLPKKPKKQSWWMDCFGWKDCCGRKSSNNNLTLALTLFRRTHPIDFTYPIGFTYGDLIAR